MSNFRFLFWQNKSKMNREMKAPIYLRITVKGKKKVEIATGHWIRPNEWDTKKHQAKGNSELSTSINSYVISAKAKLLQIQNSFTVAGSPNITAELVKERFLGVSPEQKTVLQLFDYHNSQMKEQIGKGFRLGTYKHYAVTRDKVERFLRLTYGVDDFLLENLTYKFVTDFEYYLKTVDGLVSNTAMKKIKQLKKVISIALKNEWLDKDPFANFKCYYRDPKREALTVEEIELLSSKVFSTERLTTIRDVFLFSCYTGLRFSDVQKLTPSNIIKGIDGNPCLMVDTVKTNDRCNIPLLPQAIQLIEKYRSNPECLSKAVLLPVKSNQKTNEFLKEIAELTGINKRLHFHLARHTFATTVTLGNGVSMEAVSEMLGHSNIKTTQVYAKMTNKRVSKEMNLIRSKFEVFAS